MRHAVQELDRISLSLRSCYQIIKQPSYWQRVCEKAGAIVERPAAGILYVLSENDREEIGILQLAKHLQVEAPTVTRQTQALEAAGYIERSRSLTDHRAVCLQLTRSGRQLAKRLRDAQRDLLVSALKDWSKEDREQLANLLERLSTSLATTK